MMRGCKLLVLAFAVMLTSTCLMVLAAASPISQIEHPIRVACVGDSITEFSGYTTVLAHMLGKNYSVGNFGVSGSTVSLHTDKPYMAQPKFLAAENFQPQIVIIMLGTNDAREDYSHNQEHFEDEYGKLISSFQELPSKPEVLIVKSPPILNNSLYLNNEFLMNTLIPRMDDVAQNRDLAAVNVFDAFGNHTEYFLDGVHPNPQGADVIAAEVYNTIISEVIPNEIPPF